VIGGLLSSTLLTLCLLPSLLSLLPGRSEPVEPMTVPSSGER
jgi:Cu/Ag efflux pump CusA